MPSHVVCRLCVADRGLRAADLQQWPHADAPGAEEWLERHLEDDHGLIVRRDGETDEDARKRVAARRAAPATTVKE